MKRPGFLVPQSRFWEKLAPIDFARSLISTTAVQPGLPGKSRSRVVTKPATDFYGGIGRIIGLLITLFVSTPILLLLFRKVPRGNRSAPSKIELYSNKK